MNDLNEHPKRIFDDLTPEGAAGLACIWCGATDTAQEPAGHPTGANFLVFQCVGGACAALRAAFEARTADVDTPAAEFEVDDLVVMIPRRTLAEECEHLRRNIDRVTGKGYTLDHVTHYKIVLSTIHRLTGGEFGEELSDS